jgi:hypothetical protein
MFRTQQNPMEEAVGMLAALRFTIQGSTVANMLHP